MQNSKKNWFVVSKMTRIWWILTWALKILKMSILIGSFCAKYITFYLKSTEELHFMTLKSDAKFNENPAGSKGRCQVRRFQMSGVRCQVPGVQVRGVRCQVSGVKCQVSGGRLPVLGARFQGCHVPGSQGPCVKFYGSGALSKWQKLSH